MLSLLDGKRTLDQIAALMAAKYDRPLATVLADLSVTVKQLLELGMITETPTATTQRL